MTKNEAYEELKSYKRELGKCGSWRLRKAELEEQLTSIRETNYEERIRGGENDALENMIDKIYELKQQIANAIIRSEAIRLSIERKLDEIEFPYNEVLRRRYIDGQTYERISVEMGLLYNRNYGYEYVRKVHCLGAIKYSEK